MEARIAFYENLVSKIKTESPKEVCEHMMSFINGKNIAATTDDLIFIRMISGMLEFYTVDLWDRVGRSELAWWTSHKLNQLKTLRAIE
jgi:hypothetical protein